MIAVPVSAALQVDLQAKALAAEGRQVFNFCVGEPDFPTPDRIREAGIRAIREGMTRYTNASGMTELKAAAADYFRRQYALNYASDCLAVTTGGKFAVHAALQAVCEAGDEVILPAPYWTSYYYSIVLAGAVPRVVPCRSENGWKLTPEELENACTPRTRAFILNNPNNPTGAVYTREDLKALAEVIREKDLFMIADEIYGTLCYAEEPFCAAASLDDDMRARTITINGLSKSHAMTGWRIGFAAASPEIIRRISAYLSHTTGCPNTIAQAAAIEALSGPQDENRAMCAAFRERRDRIYTLLSGTPGLRVTRPDGAFYLMPELTDGLLARFGDASAFAAALLKETGTAVVPCADYGLPTAFRMSFSLSMEEIEEGAKRLRAFAEENAGG